MTSQPAIETLHRVLICDPIAGKLFWKARTPDLFASSKMGPEKSCAMWNAANAGQEAMLTIDADGYRHGTLFGRSYRANRVIWAMVHGRWPDGLIDHVNGDPLDNRLVNLRDVSHSENQRNLSRPVNNTSGHIGVTFCKQTGRWAARIKVNRKMIHIGRFDTIEEAAAARAERQTALGFHINHGRGAA